MTRLLHPLRPALGVSFALALTTALAAGDPPTRWVKADRDPARAIPASSYAGVRFAGLDACTQAASSLSLVRWIESSVAPGRKELFEQFMDVMEDLDDGFVRLGLERKLVRTLLRRPMALGVGRLTIFGDEPLPSLALAVDVAGHEQDVKKVLLRFFEMRLDGRDMTLQQGREDGAEWYMLSRPRHNGNVVAGISDGLLLVANSKGYARDCLRSWRGRSESLADLEVAQRGVDRLGAQPLLAAVVHPPSLSRLLPYEVSDALAGLGLDGVEGMFMGAGVQDEHSRELLHLATDSEPGGVIAALLPGATRATAEGYHGEDTMAYLSGEADGADVLGSLMRVFRALPNGVRSEIERDVLRDIQREMGRVPPSLLALSKEFGEHHFQHTLSVTMPGTGSGLIPTGLLVLDPKQASASAAEDGGGVAAAMCLDLEDVLSDLGLEVKRARFRGMELRYFRVPDVEVRVSPAFGVHEGRLLVSSDLRALKAAIGRKMQSDKDAGAGGSQAHRAHVVGTTPVSSLLEVRAKNVLAAVWPMVDSSLRMFDEESELSDLLDIDAVPDTDEIVEAMRDTRIGVRRHRRGVDWMSESSIGLGSVIALFGATLDDMLATAAGEKPRVH